MEITLEQLLASRDERHTLQMQLLQEHPDKTLVCLTVVMPGSVKRNEQSLTVAKAAVEALKQCFNPYKDELLERDLPTGYEAYLLTDIGREKAKRMTCEIEDHHPLGRLFDMDVLDETGVPIPRTAVGSEPRRCLICDNEARYCMRNRTHTQEELQQHINQIIHDYVHGV